jgi:hypothetical protein
LDLMDPSRRVRRPQGCLEDAAWVPRRRRAICWAVRCIRLFRTPAAGISFPDVAALVAADRLDRR